MSALSEQARSAAKTKLGKLVRVDPHEKVDASSYTPPGPMDAGVQTGARPVSFWMYVWFCQYLLIWYANQPEETVYYVHRWQGTWPVMMLLDVVLNWGIPFLVLPLSSGQMLSGRPGSGLPSRPDRTLVRSVRDDLSLSARWALDSRTFGMGAAMRRGRSSRPDLLLVLRQCPRVVPLNDPYLCEESSIPV